MPSDLQHLIGDREWPPVKLKLGDPVSQRYGFEVTIGQPRRPKRNKVVLLVHGASASSNTFTVPSGGLLAYLEHRGFDVYTVDWRSSMLTAPGLLELYNVRTEREKDQATKSGQPAAVPANAFTLDESLNDLAAAVKYVAEVATDKDESRVRVLGHCIGGALVAHAIARGGYVDPQTGMKAPRFAPTKVVLTTLGLFFKVGLEGWVKGNDFVLEDLLAQHPGQHLGISAGVAHERNGAWPEPLENRYKFWLDSGFHHGCGKPFCQRIAFMYGMPFRLDDMRYLHDSADGLEQQFGAMPLGIYAHCLRNLRRGFAADYAGPDTYLVEAEARSNFNGRQLTLITGNENQVWHRTSIDLMHEWLTNGGPKLDVAVQKRVLLRYGHQDLYWSSKAPDDVYPLILQALDD